MSGPKAVVSAKSIGRGRDRGVCNMRPQILMRSWPGNLARRLKATGWMLAALTATAGSVAAAPVFFEAGGSAAPASIQSTVDAFRAALGDPNNGNAPGPLASGHREINWDGGGPR
jgi:hypothetical protein